jgi:hypothetical protein
MEAASGGEHHPAAEPRAVAAAADDAASVLDLACVLSRVLPALPPDSRARAACVRRAWRTAAADPAAWAELDFRSCAGRLPNWRPLLLPVPQPYPPSLVVDKTLAALCARAGAALRTLRCDTDVCGGVTVEGILAALRGGGCVGVRHLAVRQDYYRYPERFRDQQAQRRLGGVFGPPQGVGPPLLTLETARELLAACPLLEHAALVVSAGVADSAEVAAALPGPLSVVLRREGAEAPLRDMLLSSVTKLDLTFYDDDFGDVGALALAQALRVNVALTVLKLEHINIGAEGGVALAEALHVNTALTGLSLRGNAIGADGFAAFARALRVNRTLRSLNLGNDAGVANSMAALSEALRVNSTLTSLDLSYNTDVDAAGVTWLASALCANTALLSLALNGVNVGDAGAASLAYVLRVNSTLTSLQLRETSIYDDGAASLAEALLVNTTLVSLQLNMHDAGNVCLTAQAVAALRTAQQANGTLTSLVFF